MKKKKKEEEESEMNNNEKTIRLGIETWLLQNIFF